MPITIKYTFNVICETCGTKLNAIQRDMEILVPPFCPSCRGKLERHDAKCICMFAGTNIIANEHCPIHGNQ
jgi:DNA-directed RNA polymerase subunit RPC12/RpoP